MIALPDLRPGDIISRRGRTFFVVEVAADHAKVVEAIEVRELHQWTLVSHASDRDRDRK